MFWTQERQRCVKLAGDREEPEGWEDGGDGCRSRLKGTGRFLERDEFQFRDRPFPRDGGLELRRSDIGHGGGET